MDGIVVGFRLQFHRTFPVPDDDGDETRIQTPRIFLTVTFMRTHHACLINPPMFVRSEIRSRVKDPGDDSILRGFNYFLNQSTEFKETLRQFQELPRDHPNYNVDYLEGKVRNWIGRKLQDDLGSATILLNMVAEPIYTHGSGA